MVIDFSEVPSFANEPAKAEAQVQSIFVKAARSIMLEHQLEFGTNKWDVTALELYLHNANWQDPTTHCSPMQLEPGRWYVHCTKRGNLRAAQYTGIDITAGSTNQSGEKTYAGLLIREIDKIDGSAKAFQTIIRGQYDGDKRGWGEHEKKSIGEIHEKNVMSGPLRLVRRNGVKQEQLWIGPRKLPTKAVEARAYKNMNLRVATWKTRVHIEKMKSVEGY